MLANGWNLDRRGFLKAGGAGLSASGLLLTTPATAAADVKPLTEKEKLARMASNSWPIRYIFKSRTNYGPNPTVEGMKKKYGEITMMDFPQFTKDTFPGVTHMDLFSGLFGDVTDDSMYTQIPVTIGAATRTAHEFDPSSAAGKRWLDKLASKMSATATKCQHISNNAPRDICDLDAEKRKTGIEVAKKWLDRARILGAKSMRADRCGPRPWPEAV